MKFEEILENVFIGTIVGVFVMAGVAATFLVFSDHKVRCHYYDSMYSPTGTIYQIKSDINWASDTIAFNGLTREEAMQTMAKLKECSTYNE